MADVTKSSVLQFLFSRITCPSNFLWIFQEIYVNWKVWFTPKRYMATTSETTSLAAAGKVKTCRHPLQVSIANPVISHAFTNGTLRMKIS